jgi:hypothetical protein
VRKTTASGKLSPFLLFRLGQKSWQNETFSDSIKNCITSTFCRASGRIRRGRGPASRPAEAESGRTADKKVSNYFAERIFEAKNEPTLYYGEEHVSLLLLQLSDHSLEFSKIRKTSLVCHFNLNAIGWKPFQKSIYTYARLQ